VGKGKLVGKGKQAGENRFPMGTGIYCILYRQ